MLAVRVADLRLGGPRHRRRTAAGPRGTQFDPLLQDADFRVGQLPVGRHLVGFVADRFEQQAGGGVVGVDRRAALPAGQHRRRPVQPQAAALVVLAVTVEAAGGQQRADLGLEELQRVGGESVVRDRGACCQQRDDAEGGGGRAHRVSGGRGAGQWINDTRCGAGAVGPGRRTGASAHAGRCSVFETHRRVLTAAARRERFVHGHRPPRRPVRPAVRHAQGAGSLRGGRPRSPAISQPPRPSSSAPAARNSRSAARWPEPSNT